MLGARIEGATRVLGERQGYTGLDVLDVVVNCTVMGPNTPQMTTAWTPTPEELEALNKGAAVHVHLMGRQHPPIRVDVGPLPD